MHQSKLWVSLLILLVIGLHALPVLSYQGVGQTRWPFLVWAMYAKSFPPGPVQTRKRGLIGETASGKEEAVTPELTGLSKATFRNFYINPLFEGDSAKAHELIRRLNRNRQDPFVRVWTDGVEYTVGDGGLRTEKFAVNSYAAPADSK